jgi:hypothetical protein
MRLAEACLTVVEIEHTLPPEFEQKRNKIGRLTAF